MNVALKEWASVVAALDAGVQICLLRKGGIVEADRGFQLRHRRFLLFPTHEHEHGMSLKPESLRFLEIPAEDSIRLQLLCEVTGFGVAPNSLEALKRADPYFIWNDRFLTKRLEYKPALPLYWILVRAFRLPQPVSILARPSYAGCKSWVHLTEEIDTAGAEPVLPDERYSAIAEDFRLSLS